MNLKCFFGKHKYKVIRKIDWNVQELECVNCKKQFAINHSVRCVLPLDEELKHANDIIIGVFEHAKNNA